MILSLGAKIRERRKALGLTQAELAAKIGATDQSISDWEKERTKVIAQQNLEKLADVLKVSTDWLLGRNATPLPKPLTIASMNKRPEYETMEMPEMHRLPLVGSVAANHLPTFTEARETELVSVKYSKANHYCLKVKGQSMKPTICEGDICVVEKVYYHLDELLEEVGPADKQLWKSLHKKVVCASVDDDDPVLKRLFVADRKDTGFKLRLAGDNRQAEEIEIVKESRLKIFGIVRSIMRDPANFE
jgi:SOS-response transcriptional repressor LexA